jgi:hypothetical protein
LLRIFRRNVLAPNISRRSMKVKTGRDFPVHVAWQSRLSSRYTADENNFQIVAVHFAKHLGCRLPWRNEGCKILTR